MKTQALRAVTEVRWQRQLFCEPSCGGSETSVTALTGGGNKLSRGSHMRAQLIRNAIRAAFTGACALSRPSVRQRRMHPVHSAIVGLQGEPELHAPRMSQLSF